MSGWISKVDAAGQPKNAVTVMYVFGACILCTILPSQVGFTSLVSAGAIPTIAAYGLVSVLRLTMTPGRFKSSYFYLGKFGKPFYACAAVFNAIVFSVSRIVLTILPLNLIIPKVMISPFFFPVTTETFNFVSQTL
jgi:translation initiation factor 5B